MRRFAFIFVLVLFLTSCSLSRTKLIKVTQWNLQCFYDGKDDGIEYEEYRKASLWNQDTYVARLKRLGEAMKKLDADVFVFEEIENQRILYDIFNFTMDEWQEGRLYRYGAFIRGKGSSLGTAVLSRYPLKDLKVHEAEVYGPVSKEAVLRPILQVTVSIGEEDVVLFVNHWKSRIGGIEQTEERRSLQQKSLANAIGKVTDGSLIAAGDFNRDVKLFDMRDGFVSLSPEVSLYCPFDESEGTYLFEGEWSTIDLFMTRGLCVEEVKVEKEGGWYDDGHPVSYRIWTSSGYSDHLPVSLSFTF